MFRVSAKIDEEKQIINLYACFIIIGFVKRLQLKMININE